MAASFSKANAMPLPGRFSGTEVIVGAQLTLVLSPAQIAADASDLIGEEVSIFFSDASQSLGMIIQVSEDKSDFELQMFDGSVWRMIRQQHGARADEWVVEARLW